MGFLTHPLFPMALLVKLMQRMASIGDTTSAQMLVNDG